MVTQSELRERALALPEVAEGSHFGMPAFAVQGSGFASISKDGWLQLRLGAADVEEAVRQLPEAEPVLRKGAPIGVAAPLAVLTTAQLDRWLPTSWADRAPAALVRDQRPGTSAVDS